MRYAPELDSYAVLDTSLAFYYQSQIGVLRWMVDLGWVDINTEVSMLDSCLALTREVCLEAALHVYGCLRSKHNTRLSPDPSHPDIGESQFLQCDWK